MARLALPRVRTLREMSRITRIILAIPVLGVAFLAGALIVAILNYQLLLGAASPAPSTSSTQADASRVPTAPRSPSPRPGESGRGEVVTLVGAGDIAECDAHEDELTADLVEAIPGIVFTLGDNVNDGGSMRNFEDCYGPTWGRPGIKERTRPTIGNKEYATPDAAAYFEYFGAAAGDPGAGYYAYDAGAWRVYVLNSNCGKVGGCSEGSRQGRWLAEDLAANPRDCVLAMWHHPLFSSGPHARTYATADLWRLLDDAGAELVLSGNTHAYERFAPQTANGDPDPRGIVQVIAGTGGSPLTHFAEPASNSMVRAARTYGVLKLELAPTSYAFEFIGVAGPEFRDRGVAPCH